MTRTVFRFACLRHRAPQGRAAFEMLSAAAQILGTQIADDMPTLLALNRKELRKHAKEELEERVSKKVLQEKKKVTSEAHIKTPVMDDAELKLNKIARKVVKFFNVLRKQQRELAESKPKDEDETRDKFMRMLKDKKDDRPAETDTGKPDFLKSDYMLGAKPRDFDKPIVDQASAKDKRARKSKRKDDDDADEGRPGSDADDDGGEDSGDGADVWDHLEEGGDLVDDE